MKPVSPRIAAAAAVALVCVTAAGGISILRETRKAGENRRTARPEESITIALVQQNTDPRKDDYEKSFTVLRTLTDQAVEGDPGLVVWSETAFVPNIRRWGAMDPAAHPYASLVRRFRDYQRGLGRWLLTGNDDYENVSLTDPADGSVTTERKDYNAAVLFSDRGERMETYRKIRLVPFTESFPYRETFPRLYQFLLDFDVYLWEPGTERIVFRHPSLPFSTPICFEDSFPGEVREFVDAGAWAIINISNDFWSLTEVEAEQHLANALFRAVENRCPLLRASASGVTCQIDRTGRIRKRLPCYEEGYLLCEVEASAPPLTLYRRWGDWFPWLCGFIVILCYAIRRILPMEIR